MKYMGSKRAMLQNGLGHFLEKEVIGAKRFIDLFTGSAAVAAFVAQRFAIPVIASDLQLYSVILANAILDRKRELDWQTIWTRWYEDAKRDVLRVGRIPSVGSRVSRKRVVAARQWCGTRSALPITIAYGGFYFSPRQSVWIDAFRRNLPKGRIARNVALASLIRAASQCVASPGHTAQPFQPTLTGKRFIAEAWRKNIAYRVRHNFKLLAKCHALEKGEAHKADANQIAKRVTAGDVVFVDPPYSGVHYSRFYHVLETIAVGKSGRVSGRGRYPNGLRRARSRYSLVSEASDALNELLQTLSASSSKVIMTFPNHKCSNGLSGYLVQKIAAKHFSVRKKSLASRFSSLGGTGDNRGNEAGRAARRHTRELVLTLLPPKP